jgi:hypothetical protein
LLPEVFSDNGVSAIQLGNVLVLHKTIRFIVSRQEIKKRTRLLGQRVKSVKIDLGCSSFEQSLRNRWDAEQETTPKYRRPFRNRVAERLR